MTLRGGLDALTHRRLVGWAWDSGAPDVAVALVVAVGGVLGRVTMDRYREDLGGGGYGLGNCGFDLAFPANLLRPRGATKSWYGGRASGSPRVLGPAVRVAR